MVYNYVDASYQNHCEASGIPSEDCSLTDRVYQDFIGANFIWIAISLCCYMLSNVSRAFQWMILLEPMGHRPKFFNSFWAVMLGYFANLGLPRMGEFIRTGIISRYEKIPYEKVFATVVNSRILDLLFLGLTTLIAMILEFDQIQSFFDYIVETFGLSSLYILGVLGFLGLIIFILILKAPPSNKRLLKKIQDIIASFKDGLLSIIQVEKPWQLLAHTAAIWSLYVLMTYVGFLAYSPTSEVQFSAGLVVFVIGALGFVVPSSGGMGTYHAMMIVGLSLYGISEVDAFSFAMIMFITLQIGANIFFGLLSLILLPKLNQRPAK